MLHIYSIQREFVTLIETKSVCERERVRAELLHIYSIYIELVTLIET